MSANCLRISIGIPEFRRVRILAPLAAVWLFGTAPMAGASPAVEHWTTSNGARVFFVAAPELPMVDVRIVFDAGSARDSGRGGLAQLTNRLLSEGAGTLSADQIAERFEAVGAQFGTGAYRDMAVATLRSLTDEPLLKPALDTLALVLREPTFPPDALERERKRLLIALRAEQESPGDIASKAFFQAIYADHPYGVHPLGSEESIAALTRENIEGFYKDHYAARNAIVAIVGALDRPGAEALAALVVGGLPAGEPAPPLAAVRPLMAGSEMRIDHPSQQSHILQGQPGMARDDPDYFPLYVGNHILGGSGLVSRINEQVREQRGLSYSAYSYFSPMHAQGPFIAGLQTRNDQADDALKVLRDVLRDFVANGPTPEELTAAKKNITGGFPLRISSNGKIAENIAMIGFYGLALDYLDTFTQQVDAVTIEQIRDAFQRRLKPEKMATVIVGGTQTSEQQ